MDTLSLWLNKERAKENQPKATAFGNRSSRRSDDERRGFLFGKIPPSWAHKRTPKMGSLLANILAFPSCLKFLQTGVRSRWQKFLQSYLRAPFVSAFGLPNADASTESLTLRKNIEALAPLFLRAPREAPEGTSGRPSSATSWGVPRSGIKNRYTERAKLGEAVGAVVSS